MRKKHRKRSGRAVDNRSLRRLDGGSDPGNVFRLYDVQDVGEPMTSVDRLYRVVMVKSMVNPDYNRGRIRMFRVEFTRAQSWHLHFSVGDKIRLSHGRCIVVHTFIPNDPAHRSSRGITKGLVIGVLVDNTMGSTNYQVHET